MRTIAAQRDARVVAARRAPMLLGPVAMWAAFTVVLGAVQYLSVSAKGGVRARGLPGAVQGWLQYDSMQYLRIATDGYSAGGSGGPSIAWFPGYPLAIRAATWAGLDVEVAAVAVAALAGLAVVVALACWCRQVGCTATQRWTILGVVACYPFSWYLFGGAYGDSLFLASAVAAFLFVELDRPLLAGLVGAIATAGRPMGVALFLGLAVLTVERSRQRSATPGTDRRRWVQPRDLLVLLSGAGAAGYMVYLAVEWGSPFAFLDAQQHWSQGPSAGPGVWFKKELLTHLTSDWETPFAAKTISQGVLVIATAALVPAVRRRFGTGYAVYQALLVVMVVFGTRDFIGAGRYLLASFPSLAVVGLVLAEHRVARGVWLGVGALLLLVLTGAYAQGVYLT